MRSLHVPPTVHKQDARPVQDVFPGFSLCLLTQAPLRHTVVRMMDEWGGYTFCFILTPVDVQRDDVRSACTVEIEHQYLNGSCTV